MFRLLKLTAYFLLGYAIYEFVQGLLHIEEEKYLRSASNDSASDRTAPASQGNRLNLTGPGDGQKIRSVEADGGTTSHLVGRGVVAH